MRFRPEQRIRFSYEFNKVRHQGEQSITPAFILQGFFPNKEESLLPRFGVIASKRVGNAVKRNRGKRLLREIFRLQQNTLPRNSDWVVILRHKYQEFSYQELEAFFLKQSKRISAKFTTPDQNN